jgi:short-subunit dehydrogenase
MEILITGATSDIGSTLAAGLLRDGHRLHLHGRDRSKLQALADGLRRPASSVVSYAADLAKPEAIARMAADIQSNAPRLDLVINNAFGELEKRSTTANLRSSLPSSK